MKIFVTGISTGVGKTVVSAIITEALEADYWKPIQSGDLHATDSHRVASLISNEKTKIHPESYRLKIPASPHASAAAEGTSISLNQIKEPKTNNHLVIEGAGGLLVPLNSKNTIADLIRDDHQVIIVSSNYLGSINHTLLTAEALKSRNRNIAGIIFSGESNPESESIIESMSGCKILGRIESEPYFDHNVVSEYAEILRPELIKLKS